MILILTILFVVTMFMWLLSMLNVSNTASYSPWLGWFACLFLGLAVFLRGF